MDEQKTNDYKNFKPGKYPEPNDRKRPKDFPESDELFTYGVEVPVPLTLGDLRCKYNDDEQNPLVLQALEGYRVPPLGMKSVAKHGSGHANGFIYRPGTFRENKHTIGMELGATHGELIVARAEKRVNKIVEGVQRSLEKNGYQIPMGGVDSDINTLDVLAEIVTDKIIHEDSAREARMWFGDLKKIQDRQLDIIDSRDNITKQMAGMQPTDLKAILEYTRQVMEIASSKVDSPPMVEYEGEFEDVEDSD